MKDYGSEYPYITWRRQYRKLMITTAITSATIFIFLSVLCISIMLLPGAIDNEVSRQVAVVEKSLGVQK